MDDEHTDDRLTVPDTAAWRAWLDANEASSNGVKLVLAKKGVTDPTSLTYSEALLEALCSGWIDGRRNAIDDRTFQQHFTPRRPGSLWSQRNIGLVEALIKQGRMRARGTAEIDRAKTDGRWARAYAGQARAETPPDLSQALAGSPAAQTRFAALSKADRYSHIHAVITASTPAGRAARIVRIVQALEEPPSATP
ncbi:YdeI/OmpD-associated family protein [Kineosporia rhizophila]|uniref:YdeI/OmpD-associated family protein n=1 Tax=Kineosporia rhizophila TaxID=84633 RepID=UPI001E466F9C|nr:YdeI/OmpD-associated family protein [Kineosporia rhizophila]MCE0539753.1 YdeI/OmpD-associated family protein [Kineosporia rhizophila]